MSKRIKISKRQKEEVSDKVEIQSDEVEKKLPLEEEATPPIEELEETAIVIPVEKETFSVPVSKKRLRLNVWQILTFVFGLSTLILLVLFFFNKKAFAKNDDKARRNTSKQSATIDTNWNSDLVEIDVVSKAIGLKDFLILNDIPVRDADFLEEIAGEKFWMTLQPGDKVKYCYQTSKIPENLNTLIYEPKKRPELYYKMGLKDSLWVAQYDKEVEIRTQTASVIIEESLIESILDNGLRYDLLEYMEKALAWSIDFYSVKPGDRFKVIYEEKFIGGKSKEITALNAIYFQQKDREYKGFKVQLTEDKIAYFDEGGNELKEAFLKSPLKYGRITSGYSLARKHPVTGVMKGHFGTDYAAPEGTPILAVGDGVISKAEFKQNNGNYVKIHHDLQTYETQYLHMSRFAPNIKPGVRVKQGQVIGFVGSTGLATGPHVCFRFWKAKKQIDHRKESIAHSARLPSKFQSTFRNERDSLKKLLNLIQF